MIEPTHPRPRQDSRCRPFTPVRAPQRTVPNPHTPATPDPKLQVIPGDRYSPQVARDIIGSMLGEHHPCLYNARLVVSELVTNAVRHTRSGQRDGMVGFVVVQRDDGHVRIEVIDNGPLPGRATRPEIRQDPPELRESGFGLKLVNECATRWGVRPESNHYCTVWAELSP